MTTVANRLHALGHLIGDRWPGGLEARLCAELARTLPEAEDTNSNVNLNGGRVYVDIGKRRQRERSASEVAVELRQKISRLVGAEYVVMDDLSGNGKPVQIEFSGPDSRKLMELTNAYMAKPTDFSEFLGAMKHLCEFWLHINQPPPPAMAPAWR